ncbi:MAG: hypothetical protein UIB63_06175 [Methanobrevibacter sp.]|uniref:hypothetical protein n=1 Tax=Methanobrevibacter sp. TaxID=66852 RepID=UPI002E7697F1|nr:hypothetical protein [Methanobrevibacter sp.]MEE0942678.1 hypothetical protein [Methanobrevibacter sp.]
MIIGIKLEKYLNLNYIPVQLIKEHGAGFDSPRRYRITILAPEDTRGTRMNDQYGSLTFEREWLLKRHQRFEVLEFDDAAVMMMNMVMIIAAQ